MRMKGAEKEFLQVNETKYEKRHFIKNQEKSTFMIASVLKTYSLQKSNNKQ
jgi:hypothetical protein